MRSMLHAIESGEVTVKALEVTLSGTLSIPPRRAGVVLFAHGSGSSRHSPRNQYVARVLQHAGFATLLLDLLTRDEELIDARTGHLRFDIDLLAGRLVGAADWLGSHPNTAGLGIGLFGASTGAAAALVAAARRPQTIRAVVSRGGRPDLAAGALRDVKAPTLLIVGGADHMVITLNEEALNQLQAESELAIVSRAGHLFEEPGALEQVAELACKWFTQHLATGAAEAHAGKGESS